jgi:hypothetical protein
MLLEPHVRPEFVQELVHLRSSGLINHFEGKGIVAMQREGRGDLHDHFYITDLGREYLKLRRQIESEAETGAAKAEPSSSLVFDVARRIIGTDESHKPSHFGTARFIPTPVILIAKWHCLSALCGAGGSVQISGSSRMRERVLRPSALMTGLVFR